MNDKIMKEFKVKYPKADYSKFYVDVDDHGRVGVFTNAGILGTVSVTSQLFLDSEYAKWLTANEPRLSDSELIVS